MARLICASWTRSVDDTGHLLCGRAGVVALFTGLRPPAQEALAVEVGLAAGHGPGVVLVLVELQREERFARGLAHVVLDVRAVSYTHLRAHETRHDLVCRLLL